MRKNLLLPALLLIATNSFCQVVSNVDWVRNYSERDQLENVPSAIDANNNVYITGYTVFGGTRDFTTIKYDANGTQQWVQHYNNIPGGDDRSNAVVVDASGNIYVTGQSQGTGTGFDYATIKYNANGVQQWVARYDGTASSDDIAVAIAVDNSGNVYVTGRSRGTSSFMDYATVKYNSSGVQQWVSRYNGTANGDDGAVALALGSGNRVYVTGTARMTGTGNDAVTIRYNANNGNQMWATATNGTNNGSDAGYAILADGNNVVVCGMVGNTSTHEDYFLYKFNGNNGAVQIQKTYDGYGLSDYATGLVMDSQGNYVITGVSRNISSMEYHTVKFNSSGTQQWVNKRVLNQSFTQVSPKVAVDFVDHLYVCGEINISNNIDMLLYQITPGGNTTWTETHNGTQNGNDVAVDLVMGNLGVIYLAGQTQNSNAKFDYTTIKYSQTPVVFPPDFNNEPNDKTTLFYENKGQLRNMNLQPLNAVKFYTKNHNPALYFGNMSLSLVYSKIDTSITIGDTLHRVDLTFKESNAQTKIYQFEQGKGHLNYYYGHLPAQGITDVKGYERLMIPNLYPNIDLHYYTNRDGIKYYFVVKPGGNPSVIQHFFSGATSTGINGTDLEIATTLGSFVLQEPIAYQVNFSLNIVPLGTASWNQVSTDLYNFNLPTYNSILPLIIMIEQSSQQTPVPAQNLCWSTYFGGVDDDISNAVDVDNLGNQYIAGQTLSSEASFPITTGVNPFQATNTVGVPVSFYARFGTAHDLDYSTFYGGNNYTSAWDLKAKNSNEIFVVGYTTADNLITLNPGGGAYYDGVLNASGAINRYDGYLTKFDGTGALTWATYFGGDDWDEILAIDLDNSGNLIATGYGNDPGFPLQNLGGAYNQGGNSTKNMFVAKFGSTNNALTWSTFFGGSTDKEEGHSIHIDVNNNLFVSGFTYSTDFPTQNPGGGAYFDNSLNGTFDDFITKFSPTGSLLWSSYIGGDGDESLPREGINAITTDGLGNLFMVGTTSSTTNFTLLNPGGTSFFDNTHSGNSFVGDGYIMEFNKNTAQLIWSTLVSGTGPTWFRCVSADANGNVFVGGSSGDATNPLVQLPSAYYQNTLSGGPTYPYTDESYLFHFNSARELKWSTFFGGYNDFVYGEWFNDFVIDGNVLYATGFTTAQSNVGFQEFPFFDPGSGAYFDNTYNGNIQDAFLSMFCLNVVTGIESSEELTEFSVYPNPTENNVFVNLGTEYVGQKVLVEIYDVSGKLILSESNKFQGTPLSFNTSEMANGMYLLKMTLEDGTYAGSEKFIKK